MASKFPVTGDIKADQLLEKDPLALTIGCLSINKFLWKMKSAQK